ncbi:hypothetical protein HDV06_001491 [Boothiomyces sp. JEL0866]|nr:hypothetical protein HDV06_001491 [Boothiomyces sp. JEL0866]
MINIDDILVDGKIRSKTWKKLTNEEREQILESIDDEEYLYDILVGIAPKNRDVVIPKDYLKQQVLWREKNNEPRIPSRESVDVVQQTMLTEFLKIQKENNEEIIQNNKEIAEINEKFLEIVSIFKDRK